MEQERCKLILGDCLEQLEQLEDKSIDLVVTSPPYYNSGHRYQRGKGFHYSKDVGEPLYLIFDAMEKVYPKLKDGGMICLNLCFSYGETGVMRPFDIVNRLRNKIGYFVNDLIIWHKNNPIPLQQRLTNAYELIFVLSKHPIGKYYTKEYEHNVWKIPVEKGYDSTAVFPLKLAEQCLKHFSKSGDLVLDCFMGSGTTGVAAAAMERTFIGIELTDENFKIAEKRIKEVENQSKLVAFEQGNTKAVK